MDHVIRHIAHRARDNPDAIAIRFVENASGGASTTSWLQLKNAAWAAREEYARRGLVPGNRILLLLPTGSAYVSALLGALWAGLVPTTLHVLRDSKTFHGHEVGELIDAFAPHAIVGADRLQHAPVQTIPAETFGRPDLPAARSADFSALRDLSYVQFTSGSTGRPRGLVLSWSAIGANLEAIAEATGMGPGQQAVSWLPMYHDMGLFGSLLACLQAGCEHTLMDPSVFAANPLIWLRVMHERNATITVAPPSALKACLDLLRRRPRTDLDLSSLKQVICGSEPISSGLLRIFAEGFEPFGVLPSALRPVYGLAEATLAVTFTPSGRSARSDCIDRQRFESTGQAVPAPHTANAPVLEWVSAGSPLPGIEVRIIGDDGQNLPERSAGRIWVRSPCLYSALLENGRFTPRAGDWLDTGDAGYVADGELYVTGRLKDLIIKNGRNFSPERLEELAGGIEGVRRCAAFGLFDENRSTERIILMIEAHPRHLENPETRDRLRLAVRGELSGSDYPVDEVCLVARGTLPLTTSGKVRRQQCRDVYFRMPSLSA